MFILYWIDLAPTRKPNRIGVLFTRKNGDLVATTFIAELWRAKRACGAPWVRKCGKLSIRENLVIT